MRKTVVLLVLGLLLSVGLASHGETVVVSPKPSDSFFSGDKIVLDGYFSSNTSCSGSVGVILDNVVIDHLDVSFSPGSVVSFDSLFENTTLSVGVGGHSLDVFSDCFGTTHVNFDVSGLELVYDLSSSQLMLGQQLRVKARGVGREPVPATIEIDSAEYVGNASIVFQTPGLRTLLITAQDSFGNKAQKTIPIEVSDTLVLNVSINRNSLKPLERLVMSVDLYSAFGQKWNGTVSLVAFDTTALFDVQGHAVQEMVVPFKTKTGEHELVLTASDGKNKGEKRLKVSVESAVVFIVLDIEKSFLDASDTLRASTRVFDPSGIEIQGKINISLADEQNNTFFSKAVDANSVFEYAVANKLKFGAYTLRATGFGIEDSQVFFVKRTPLIKMTRYLEAGKLKVNLSNEGNVDFPEVSLEVCDNTGCVSKKFSLNVSDSVEPAFDVSGDARVTLEYEGEKKTEMVSLAGGFFGFKTDQAFLIAVLGLVLVALVVFYLRRRRKPRFALSRNK